MLNAFTNYLEKLGNNFLVASMVPSLALIVSSLMMFDPILEVSSTFKDAQVTYQSVRFVLILFIITVIIGYTLTALNTFILKMFEGYVTPFPVRFLYTINRQIHRRKAFDLKAKRDELEVAILEMEERNPEWETKLENLRSEYYKAASKYDLNYPESPEQILPTRFGNTLKAAENYPGERYGFEGVQLWPRLLHVIPPEYKQNIDGARNELSFLVNMSILSMIFSTLCICAFFYSMWSTDLGSGGLMNYLAFMSIATKYLIAAAAGFLSCGFFYNASIFSVSSFGLMIRSAFDLFRLDLLKKLELVRPNDSIQEFETWSILNELIVLGSHSLTFQKLDYRPEEDTQSKKA